MQAAQIKKVLDETVQVVSVGISNKENALRQNLEKKLSKDIVMTQMLLITYPLHKTNLPSPFTAQLKLNSDATKLPHRSMGVPKIP